MLDLYSAAVQVFSSVTARLPCDVSILSTTTWVHVDDEDSRVIDFRTSKESINQQPAYLTRGIRLCGR